MWRFLVGGAAYTAPPQGLGPLRVFVISDIAFQVLVLRCVWDFLRMATCRRNM
jgi:hypothetical protein